MKTIPIPVDIEARLTHECPQLAALLGNTDGRLELERFAYLMVSDESEGTYLDERLEALHEDAYDSGYEDGLEDGRNGG